MNDLVDNNDTDATYRVTATELRQIVEQIERVNAEIEGTKEVLKENFAAAKARGYDVKVLRHIIKLRKRDRDEISEEEAVMEMYKEALGM
jgi:uncharacterized protein (UPF0335 family)